MRFKQSTLKIVSECVALARLPCKKKQGLRIFTYHSIGSSAYGDYSGLNTASIESFTQQMDVVASMQSVMLNKLIIPQSDLTISVTFDDGYADNLYVAAPLLAARKIPYTVFVATDFVKNKTKGFLTPRELKQLSVAPGATIGAHSLSHKNLTLCSNAVLRNELEGSKHYIEDLIGLPVTEFAYPYGLADMRVRDAVNRAGYKVGVCSHFNINMPGRDALMLNRCVILSSDSIRVFKQKIRGDWDWYSQISMDPASNKRWEAQLD
jgi:peptidoglycan/xylan/chitin deacetylase (PgdA/CDA1 family)